MTPLSPLERFVAALRGSRNPKGYETVWKIVIVAAIVLFSGPEMVTSLELRILLEILGATLFTTVFFAGARLVVSNFAARFAPFFAPDGEGALLHPDASLLDKRLAATYFSLHFKSWLTFLVACLVGVCVIVDFFK